MRLRRGAVAAAVVAVAVVVLAVDAGRQSGTAGEPDRADRPQQSTTSTAWEGEPTATTTDEQERTATSGGPGAPGTARTPAPTVTTLPGVIDRQDPRAVATAVIDLAAAGEAPDEADRYLAGGQVQIATELFMLAGEGLTEREVGPCTAVDSAGLQTRCGAVLVTSYGARSEVAFVLDRPLDTSAWYISAIELAGGGQNGLA